MTRRRHAELSSQAQAAAMIRKNLKAAFPHTRFRVCSRSFANGDAVDIRWQDGPTTQQVDAISARHEYGSFDGMQDLYEYTNVRNDIPQSKYVQTQRDFSTEAHGAVIAYLNQYWGWSLVHTPESRYNIIDPASDFHTGNGYASHELHRTLHGMSLVCGYCKRGTLPGDKYCGDCGASLDAAPAIAEAEMILAPN